MRNERPLVHPAEPLSGAPLHCLLSLGKRVDRAARMRKERVHAHPRAVKKPRLASETICSRLFFVWTACKRNTPYSQSWERYLARSSGCSTIRSNTINKKQLKLLPVTVRSFLSSFIHSVNSAEDSRGTCTLFKIANSPALCMSCR